MDDQAENPRAVIGDNAPPQSAVLTRADEIIAVANKWVTERPVIADQDMADKAGAFCRQSTTALKAINDARLEANKPFRKQIEDNDKLHNDKAAMLKSLADIVLKRLNVFATEEKRKQDAIAAEAKRRADEAAAAAAEAKRKQDELLAAAEAGDAKGSFADVAATIAATKEADQLAKQTAAEATAASKAKVKMGGEHFTDGSRRSLSQRVVETPDVENASFVLRAVGLTDGIRAALITAAREYKREHGKWPKGITTSTSTRVQ